MTNSQPQKNIEKQIPEGWVETTLGEVIDFVVDNRGKTPPLVENGCELLEVNAVSDNAREPDYSKVSKFVDEETFRNGFRKGTIKKGDVLIPTVGTIGNASYSKEERGAIAQNLIALRINTENDSLFLYYFLTDPNTKKALLNLDIGGVQPSIKVPHLLGMQVVFPPLVQQKDIATILSSFDDKIELLREQNKTLEEMGQTIFKEWFGKYSVDRLSELPTGWRVGKAGEIISKLSIPYRCIKSDLDSSGKTPIFDQGATGLYGYTNREPDFEASREDPVILFTNHTCNYWFVDYPFCAIQNVLPYRAKDGYDIYFLYFMTRGSISFIEYKGHWPDFEAKDFIIPEVKKAQEFGFLAKPILEKISDNNLQIQVLGRGRNELLSKLMSGEVRLKKYE